MKMLKLQSITYENDQKVQNIVAFPEKIVSVPHVPNTSESKNFTPVVSSLNSPSVKTFGF